MNRKVRNLINTILVTSIIVSFIIHCYRTREIDEIIQNVFSGFVLFLISGGFFGAAVRLLYKFFDYKFWRIFINVIVVIVILSYIFLEIGIIVAKETGDIMANQFMIFGVYCGLIWGKAKALKKLDQFGEHRISQAQK